MAALLPSLRLPIILSATPPEIVKAFPNYAFLGVEIRVMPFALNRSKYLATDLCQAQAR